MLTKLVISIQNLAFCPPFFCIKAGVGFLDFNTLSSLSYSLTHLLTSDIWFFHVRKGWWRW